MKNYICVYMYDEGHKVYFLKARDDFEANRKMEEIAKQDNDFIRFYIYEADKFYVKPKDVFYKCSTGKYWQC